MKMQLLRTIIIINWRRSHQERPKPAPALPLRAVAWISCLPFKLVIREESFNNAEPFSRRIIAANQSSLFLQNEKPASQLIREIENAELFVFSLDK
jgi:hypothetical protein